ncbi:Sjogren's syndrome/scleroderma autoantigen 1 family protein [Halorubrum salsamenti]|uniref:Sjogren's syndrome/scleroderma autoantigen 1 family protein n=1 Tax=Halorubrum salsamenti TaxID=2583990 RepID=UPI0011A4834B|nr:Sjogren's syndrome/scleroderma autoantigen 1 family protein [Halorubrum salsamenti]
MSDGFDKEAEREKLREKFAEDEQEREHTQRMSELLLQGATMTNRHCDDCGDPIFRHDGQEFCPTCQATGSGDAARGGSQEAAETAAQGEARNTPREDAQAASGDENRLQGDTRRASAAGRAPPENASQNATDPTATDPTATDPTATVQNAAGSAPSNPEGSRDEPTTPRSTEPAGSGTVADARASLTRTLARFARAAEETNDPRRARDHLKAAREAAEALAALD